MDNQKIFLALTARNYKIRIAFDKNLLKFDVALDNLALKIGVAATASKTGSVGFSLEILSFLVSCSSEFRGKKLYEGF